jgi:hypothetical protein
MHLNSRASPHERHGIRSHATHFLHPLRARRAVTPTPSTEWLVRESHEACGIPQRECGTSGTAKSFKQC